MPRRRRALLIGATLAWCAIAFAAVRADSDAPVDEARAPTPESALPTIVLGQPSSVLPTTTGVAPTETIEPSTTTTAAPNPDPPAGGSETTTRPRPATTLPTTPSRDDTPLLLAASAPSPAEPQRPSGGQAVSRQRFVTIDAKATVDQLMGGRVEPIENGFRREGKAVKVLLFDFEPVRLEPIAPYVRETTAPRPTATGTAAVPTTFSWMGTGKLADTTVTASLSVSDDTHGTYRLVGTISTASSVPPLLIDWVDEDRYALTELDPAGPCLPDVAAPTTSTTAPATDPESPPTTEPGCAD